MHGIERSRSDHKDVIVFKWYVKLSDGEINTTYRAFKSSTPEQKLKSTLDVIEDLIAETIKRDIYKIKSLEKGLNDYIQKTRIKREKYW